MRVVNVMTLYKFNALPYEHQLAAVFDTGRFLATRWEEGTNLCHLLSGVLQARVFGLPHRYPRNANGRNPLPCPAHSPLPCAAPYGSNPDCHRGPRRRKRQ